MSQSGEGKEQRSAASWVTATPVSAYIKARPAHILPLTFDPSAIIQQVAVMRQGVRTSLIHSDGLDEVGKKEAVDNEPWRVLNKEELDVTE
ncbi:hypothetical protein EYF80_000006 [Liparis tanakae]|uniref:Uncharacterized protein n=1 Tax=Liparis tanakae TaxID=230148 RepID=A0A4Z2JHX2_9TELE|nr:hypothetical protein EYF80_000006 [Liparis tanakae]